MIYLRVARKLQSQGKFSGKVREKSGNFEKLKCWPPYFRLLEANFQIFFPLILSFWIIFPLEPRSLHLPPFLWYYLSWFFLTVRKAWPSQFFLVLNNIRVWFKKSLTSKVREKFLERSGKSQGILKSWNAGHPVLIKK